MRKVYCAGESLVDIIFSDGQPRAASAGGAMLNTSVSLGRIGMPVFFISEYGNDDPGGLIDIFLRKNGVNTDYISRYSDGRTAIALAFLDENNEAHYTFYKQYPEKRLEANLPGITPEDIFLFGSIYAITQGVREKLFPIAVSAFEKGAVVIYDPNFRRTHGNEKEALLPIIKGNMNFAGIVRASDEDCRNIFGANDAEEAWKEVSELCGCLVYTAGKSGVSVFTDSYRGHFPVKNVKPVSTIGAGDTFNAGLIAALLRDDIHASDIRLLGAPDWKKIIATAVDFATEACMSYENYIGLAFASRYRSASRFQM
ncbi:MAG: carbohydrate kinase [Bacteroidales bacterium]|nr:carbohydrate kinase [Bacteroidales bacterium]